MYILLFTCNFTRAIYLHLLPNQPTQEFIKTSKQLMARRVRASVVYSDKAKTFAADSMWIGKINKDDKIQKYLNK